MGKARGDPGRAQPRPGRGRQVTSRPHGLERGDTLTANSASLKGRALARTAETCSAARGGAEGGAGGSQSLGRPRAGAGRTRPLVPASSARPAPGSFRGGRASGACAEPPSRNLCVLPFPGPGPCGSDSLRPTCLSLDPPADALAGTPGAGPRPRDFPLCDNSVL